jgi:MoxR-like ATPase
MNLLDTSTRSSHYDVISSLQQQLNQRIIGQPALMLRLLIALLADGHMLVEGAPGLAKTKAVKELAAGIECNFQRIQFTPDLLPSDLTGTDIYRPQEGIFTFQAGPLFHNLILADEINRAPAKVQSALLEAMAERQVTIGRNTYPLPDLYLVMATQNPIEQEGTYPLPEAQLDRFMMYVRINYPDATVEQQILQLARAEALQASVADRAMASLVTQKQVLAARREVLDIYLSPALEEYLVQLIIATRDPSPYSSELASWLSFGASSRATIALDRAARAHAWLHGRDYVSPEDIHALAHDILRHRIHLSFEAQAEGVTTDHFITQLLNQVAVP